MRSSTARPLRQETRQLVPGPLRVFAWNLGPRVGREGRRQIALNVIERGRAWHWRQLPKGWFDLDYCMEHGQKRTRQVLREIYRVA